MMTILGLPLPRLPQKVLQKPDFGQIRCNRPATNAIQYPDKEGDIIQKDLKIGKFLQERT
jgi:hypothetical protein